MKTNCINANRLEQIDFVAGDFLKMNKLKGDVVFLNPMNTYNYDKILRLSTSPEGFSLLRHMEPNLINLLRKAFQVSDKVALKLPGYTDLDELAKLFNIVLERNNM